MACFYKSLIQTLAQRQIQHIQHIGQIGQMLAQSGREMREQNLRDWYHRQEVVELPAGYGHAWANNLREYILTEEADFNPNLYLNLHWEPMEIR